VIAIALETRCYGARHRLHTFILQHQCNFGCSARIKLNLSSLRIIYEKWIKKKTHSGDESRNKESRVLASDQ
jgi:hypothetical protein